MKDHSVKNLKHRLEMNILFNSERDYFDEVEHNIEFDTFQQDKEWDKKISEDELRGFNQENWFEGDYEI
ncbi:MAG: hypothetical protein BAJALOKI3v1_30031 [Promethearchaeota archaeon]|nr:MAG: hypothetical protein BAJALOKI3v1_30031 [Candidatus Lokiarchaeota archaeon]